MIDFDPTCYAECTRCRGLFHVEAINPCTTCTRRVCVHCSVSEGHVLDCVDCDMNQVEGLFLIPDQDAGMDDFDFFAARAA